MKQSRPGSGQVEQSGAALGEGAIAFGAGARPDAGGRAGRTYYRTADREFVPIGMLTGRQHGRRPQ
jgi:hypothetical protein